MAERHIPQPWHCPCHGYAPHLRIVYNALQRGQYGTLGNSEQRRHPDHHIHRPQLHTGSDEKEQQQDGKQRKQQQRHYTHIAWNNQKIPSRNRQDSNRQGYDTCIDTECPLVSLRHTGPASHIVYPPQHHQSHDIAGGNENRQQIAALLLGQQRQQQQRAEHPRQRERPLTRAMVLAGK